MRSVSSILISVYLWASIINDQTNAFDASEGLKIFIRDIVTGSEEGENSSNTASNNNHMLHNDFSKNDSKIVSSAEMIELYDKNVTNKSCNDYSYYKSGCGKARSSPTNRTHLNPNEMDPFPVSSISFSSCIKPKDSSEHSNYWKHVRYNSKPDLWIWLGDNVYADGNDMGKKRKAYDKVRKNVGYRTYGPIGEPKIPVTGVWDDHDFGSNNDGGDYKCKDMSQKEFCIHFNIPKTDVRHPDYNGDKCKQKGIYGSHIFPPPLPFDQNRNGVHVINLDTRYDISRTTNRCNLSIVPTILGEAQWDWLKYELFNITSEIKIISTSIQALSPTSFDEGGIDEYCAYKNNPDEFIRAMEVLQEGKHTGTLKRKKQTWSEIPAERLKLLRWAQKSINTKKTKKIIFISGGMHYGDLLAKRMPEGKYWGKAQTLYEVVASGIGKGRRPNRPNANRVRLRTCDDTGDDNFIHECKFPFVYNGKTYSDCAPLSQDSSQSFCYYNEDEEKWGYCLEESEEVVPRKNQILTKNYCGDYHQACSTFIYGNVQIDWKNDNVILSVFTPKKEEEEGLVSSVIVPISS